MGKLNELFDNIVIFDTETTGLDPEKQEIIELAAVRLEHGQVADRFDYLVKMADGKHVPTFIRELTGITDEDLEAYGVEKTELRERFCDMLSRPKTLLVAYNAQFDLCFLYHFLRRFRSAEVLNTLKFLDALSVYRDRAKYPHKLSDAVAHYGLETQNTHRAIDDAQATAELLQAMEAECDDLEQYINLFGYVPKYGVSGKKISSVRYEAQPYDATCKLYETEQQK